MQQYISNKKDVLGCRCFCFKKKKLLFYHISKLHNSYFIYFVYVVYFILLAYFIYLRGSLRGPLGKFVIRGNHGQMAGGNQGGAGWRLGEPMRVWIYSAAFIAE